MTNVELFQLIKEAKNSYSLFVEDENIDKHVKQYENNCQRAKVLSEKGLLDYKTGYDGFVNKYDELLRKYNQHLINNPSWFMTGRGGRNFSKHEKKMDQLHNKETELSDLLDRLSEDNIKLMEQRQLRKSLKPATYKEQAERLLHLYDRLNEVNEFLKNKNNPFGEKLIFILDNERIIQEINQWYISERSNRRIQSLLGVSYRAGYIIDWDTIHFMNKEEFWKIINSFAVNYTGSIKKSTFDNLAYKIKKLQELSALYDKPVLN